ncbi:MAG: hypothetical protein LBQ62_02105, partial [Candidatus Accumulibacter sp.]|nr:hypothetical protein [Accumulibacter sp.]
YDKNGKLLLSNESPFEGYPILVNHIGGIDVFNGEIFVSAGNFMDGVGKDIQIGTHDARTLKLKRAFAFEPRCGLRMARQPARWRRGWRAAWRSRPGIW